MSQGDLKNMQAKPINNSSTTDSLIFAFKLFAAVLIRPGLWKSAFTTLKSMTRERWYCRMPFLPLPDANYLAFRNSTAQGDPESLPSVKETVEWLSWCKSMQAISGSK